MQNFSETGNPVRMIEDRAKTIGLSIAEICRRAGIANSTFKRWKSGQTEPQFRVYRKLLSALENAENEMISLPRQLPTKKRNAQPRERSGSS